MADPLEVVGKFDPSEIIEGFQKTQNAALQMAASTAAAFKDLEAAEAEVADRTVSYQSASAASASVQSQLGAAEEDYSSKTEAKAQAYSILAEAQGKAQLTASELIAIQSKGIESDELLTTLTEANVDAQAALSRAYTNVATAEQEYLSSEERVISLRNQSAIATERLAAANAALTESQGRATIAAGNVEDAQRLSTGAPQEIVAAPAPTGGVESGGEEKALLAEEVEHEGRAENLEILESSAEHTQELAEKFKPTEGTEVDPAKKELAAATEHHEGASLRDAEATKANAEAADLHAASITKAKDAILEAAKNPQIPSNYNPANDQWSVREKLAQEELAAKPEPPLSREQQIEQMSELGPVEFGPQLGPRPAQQQSLEPISSSADSVALSTETTEVSALTQAYDRLATARKNVAATLGGDQATHNAALSEEKAAVEGIVEAKEKDVAVSQQELDAALAQSAATLGGNQEAHAEALENEAAATAKLQAAKEALAGSMADSSAAVDVDSASQEANTLATTAANDAAEKVTITVGEGVAQNAALTSAINSVAAAQSGAVTNSAALDEALKNLEAVAKQLGATVQQDGNSLNVVLVPALEKTAVAAEEAAEGMSTFERGVARGVPRMIAVDAGASQLGYTFSILAGASETLGRVMNLVFYPVLIVTFAEVIGSLVEKFTKLEDEIRKAGHALDDIGDSARSAAESLELQNLKMDDQISKLEGAPANNRLKAAILETRLEVDRLNKSFGDTIEKEIQALENADVSKLTGLLTGEKPTSVVGSFGSDFADVKAKEAVYSEKLALQQQAIDKQKDLDATASKEQQEAAQKQVSDAEAAAEGAATAVSTAAQKLYDSLETEKNKRLLYIGTTDQAVIDKIKEDNKKIAAEYKNVPQEDIPYEHVPKLITPEDKGATEEQQKLVEYYAREQSYALDVLNTIKEQAIAKKEVAEAGGNRLEVAGLENDRERLAILEKQLDAAKNLEDIHSKGVVQRATIEAKGTGAGEAESPDKQAADEQKAADAQYAIDRALLIQKADLVRNYQDQYTAALNSIAKLDATYEEASLDRIARRTAAGKQATDQQALELEKLSGTQFTKELVRTAEQPKDNTADIAEQRKENELELRSIEDETRQIERRTSLGHESRLQEVADLEKVIALLKQKQQEESAPIQNRINKLQAATYDQTTNLPQANLAPGQYEANIKELATLQEQLNTLTRQYNVELQNVGDQVLKLNTSFGEFFTRMQNETLNFTQTLQTSFEGVFTQLNSGFANSVGQWIERGGNFGQAMANLGVHLLTHFTEVWIQMGLRQLESHAAALAGIKSQDAAASIGKTTGIPSLAGAPGQIAAGPAQAALTTNTTTLTANTTAVNANTAALQANVAPNSAALEAKFPEHYNTAGALGEETPAPGGETLLASGRTSSTGAPVLETPAQFNTAASYGIIPPVQQTIPQPTIPQQPPPAATLPLPTAGAPATAAASANQAQLIAQQAQQTAAVTAAQTQQTAAIVAAKTQQTAVGAAQTTTVATEQTAQTAAVLTANTTQVASTAAAGSATVAITKATTAESRLEKAKDAAAGAWDALSGIPVVGPVLGAAAAAATFAAILAFAGGGHVQGAGTGTSDSIPAMLSHGEFVVKAAAVNQPGVLEALHGINRGDGLNAIEGHAEGGQILGFAKGGTFLRDFIPFYSIEQDIQKGQFGKIPSNIPIAGAFYDAYTKGTHSWADPLTYLIADKRKSALRRDAFEDQVAAGEVHAAGGPIFGAGTGKSDSIPAMLSHGEFVVNAEQAGKPDVLQALHAINKGEGLDGVLSVGSINSTVADSDSHGGTKFAHGGLAGRKSASSLHLAKGGYIMRFAEGGDVAVAAGLSNVSASGEKTAITANSNNVSSSSVHNNRIAVNNTINGNYDVDAHTDAIVSAIQKKLKLRGINI